MGKKSKGHFCITCGRHRPNDKFSGKGHSQHICRDCKKTAKKGRNQLGDTIFESDENFAYIVGYTEGGVPYGITHEEWDEIKQFEIEVNEDRVLIKVSKEIGDKLRNNYKEDSLELSIHTSIAISLFLTSSISIQEAASLAGRNVNEFINLLQTNRIPWSLGGEDGNKEYQKSIEDLLMFIDHIKQDENNYRSYGLEKWRTDKGTL
ncbi:putative HTH domain antitoxin [Peribacillus deserti]|uniref:HTH domain antitoxin n=1 Tax=Peribacillus deserti TaxID=673318 RepID=A0ABS2QE57_9BACI|nr:UPF0175 family protein [Peribacillus deserti]MBM7691305.1 putative HTH domain antitoxin [Peribacillus deserti]